MELRFFELEQTVSKASRLSGEKPLSLAVAGASELLEKAPENSRYADLRVALYRSLLSRPEEGFSEPADRITMGRQLDRALSACGGDWYLWMNQSLVRGYLGDEDGARFGFLRAMIRMPLYALVYGDHAAVLEFQGSPSKALHYARIASRFKDAQGLDPVVRRLEKKAAEGAHP